MDPAARQSRYRPQRQVTDLLPAPAAGPPLNTTCWVPVQVRQLLALRPRAAPWTPGAQSVPRPGTPPAARTRTDGRACTAWSGTVGAGAARGRGPGWHGARARHMSRTRPCGVWIRSPLAAGCARRLLLPCPVALPVPCLPPTSLRRVPGGNRQGRGRAAAGGWSLESPTICSPTRKPPR